MSGVNPSREPRVEVRSPSRRSIRTPIRNRPGLARRTSSRERPSTAPISRNSSSRTTWCGSPTRPTIPCWIFCRRRMKPPPVWPHGIAPRWSVRVIRRARFRELGGGDEPQTGRGYRIPVHPEPDDGWTGRSAGMSEQRSLECLSTLVQRPSVQARVRTAP